jgi:MoaA/NifB/PqqE/SkfB family radical SAM enzyme
MGLRTVEWTGGGDPTLYKRINSCIFYADLLGLEQGFITNGLLLKDMLIQPDIFEKLKWIRISMNCLDYVEEVDLDLPGFEGTLGFSYVMNERSMFTMSRLQDHVHRYKPAYVRIVPNCLATHEEQRTNNEKYSKMVANMGKPYFYQAKVFDTPDNCWWCYFKPFVLHDGWVYPCSSVVLNSGSEDKFHERYRWVSIQELPGVYLRDMKSFPTHDCDKCVFKNQNDMVDDLICPTGMENFI